MKRIVLTILLLGAAVALISCGSTGNKFAPTPLPTISGPWELIAAPNTNTGPYTGIEVALKEGQAFDPTTGQYQPNGQISASGTQIDFVSLTNASLNSYAVSFTENCPVAGPDLNGNNLVGAISGLGGAFNFTYTDNGNDFAVTATLSGDGKSMIGTYTSQAGSDCTETGAITGQVVSKLAGTYLGKLALPDSTNQDVTATLSENSSGTLTVSLVAADNTNFTLSGPVAGNFFSVTGTFNIGGQVQRVTYYGYYAGILSNSGILTQTITLANAATPTQMAGLLTIPLQ